MVGLAALLVDDEVEGEEEALAARVADGGVGVADALEAVEAELAEGRGVLEQVLFLDRVEDSEGGGTGGGLAAVGGGGLGLLECVLEALAHAEDGDGDAVAKHLADDDGVGDDAVVLGGEPRSGAPEAGELVEDEEHVVAVGDLAQAGEELVGVGAGAAAVGDRLDDDAGELAVAVREHEAFGEVGAMHAAVGVRHLVFAAVAEGRRHGKEAGGAGAGGGVAHGGGDRAGGAPVVVAGEGEELVVAGSGARDAQGGLGGLGAGVEELEDVEVAGRDGGEALHELDAHVGGEVTHVEEASRLVGDRLGDAGVGVAEGGHHVALGEVDVAVPVGVGQGDAFAVGEGDGEGVHHLEVAAVLVLLRLLEELRRTGAGEVAIDERSVDRRGVRPVDAVREGGPGRLLRHHASLLLPGAGRIVRVSG